MATVPPCKYLRQQQTNKMSRPSLILISFLVVLIFGILMVDAEERDKRSPILGLLLGQRLLNGGGHHHHDHHGGHNQGHHGGYGHGGGHHGSHHGGGHHY